MLIQHVFRAINVFLIEKNCYTFNNFFAYEQFYIDFPLFFKHFGQMYFICDDRNWFF